MRASLLLALLLLSGCDTARDAAPAFSLRLNGRAVEARDVQAWFHPADASGHILHLSRAQPDDGHRVLFSFDAPPRRQNYCFGSLVECAAPVVGITYERTTIAGSTPVGVGSGGLTITRVSGKVIEGRFTFLLEEHGPGGSPQVTGSFVALANGPVICLD